MSELVEQVPTPEPVTEARVDAPLLREAAVTMAERLYDGYRFGDWEPLAAILHPYGRFTPLADPGDRILGYDDLLAFVAGRHGTGLGTGEVQLTPLADDAVLCVAHPRWRDRVRRLTPSARAAIVTVKDGLLFRERAFASAPDAYRAYLQHGLELGLQ